MSPRKRLRSLGTLCFASLAASSILAQATSAAFEAQPVPAGTLRIWGDTYMSSVVQVWEEHFHRFHPDVVFENRLMGTDTAMPGLYGGIADLSLFGRESNATENDGFLHSMQYKPLQLRLMAGSMDAPGKSYAPVLFVHEGNPLARLTLEQADALFGCGQPGEGAPARTWGDLGLGGEWKDKPIHLYTFDMESGTGIFLLRKLQGGSKKMNWEILREFSDGRHADGTAYDAGEQTMNALKNDPYGLAVSGLQYADGNVKPLALAARPGTPYVYASRETVVDGTYSLARMTYAFVNQTPGMPVLPQVKEFLRFVYSDEGQKLVMDSNGFLPLTKNEAAKQVLLMR